MAGTKRTPLARVTNTPIITPRAIELFDRMEKCQRARRGAVGCTLEDQTGYCLQECKPCLEWRDLCNALHQELRLPPWDWPAVSHNPYPPGMPEAREWSRELSHSEWRADKLYCALRAASKAARARPAADEGAIEAGERMS
jgi:hypothetical protein